MTNNFTPLPPDYSTTEYAHLEILESGDVDIWLRRRGQLLIQKARDTARECEAGKLASLVVVGVSAVLSANPLMWLPLAIGAGGYLWTIFTEFQDTGAIKPVPLYRGRLGSLLGILEGQRGEETHPLLEEIAYLPEQDKDEVLLLRYRFGQIAGVLGAVPPRTRFDLYRHIVEQYHARQILIESDEVKAYLASAVSEARLAMPVQENKPALQSQPVLREPMVSEANNDDRTPAPQPQPDPTSEQAGLSILDAIIRTRRSTLFIGDTGAGKSVTQSYVLTKLFELHPDAEVFCLSQKADSFCGLAEQGRVTLFDPTQPEQALFLIHSIWLVYDQRRRLPESERPALSPVRLILADWLSINQSLEELFKTSEAVKASRYLSKLADIIYNGRELNVCLLVDLQSYNLAAVGLKADRNSRKNFNLIGLGNYSIDEFGMVNESYGVLVNLIGDRYIVAEESERSALSAVYKQLQPISKANNRPIIFSGLSPARLALLPDLRRYKSSKIVVSKQPVTAPQTFTEQTPEDVAIASPESAIELKVSDSLVEPLKSIWLFAKKKGDWVTAKDVYVNGMTALKGKSVKQIRQLLGLLADKGFGEIDEMDGDKPKSDSSVGFRAN